MADENPKQHHRKTHGHTSGRATNTNRTTPLYRAWQHMLTRCFNKKCQDYPDYGARGITVCERWLSFENFMADMGERPANKSLDRYPDKNGNYEPGNCRWATAREQTLNRRNTIFVTHLGQTKLLTDWSTELGINYFTLHKRLGKGECPPLLFRQPRS
jgi:hypothetical protein